MHSLYIHVRLGVLGVQVSISSDSHLFVGQDERRNVAATENTLRKEMMKATYLFAQISMSI
jgi:hypothetical protein